MNTPRQQIIIIGAGIAGLTAARALSPHHRVTVLEAATRMGGRILQLEEGFSRFTEAGAEFIHNHAVHTLQLLKEAGIAYTEVSGKMYNARDGECREQTEMIEGWDELLHKMSGIKDETTLLQLLDLHFSDAKHQQLYQQAVAYASGFDLADPARVTARSLYQEWSQPEENYRIEGGYQQLVNWLAGECKKQGCEIICGAEVTQLDWRNGAVKAMSAQGDVYEGDKCLVTIPLGRLQQKAVRFDPDIPQLAQAVNHIGFGEVIKVMIEFKERCWHKDAGFYFSDEAFPTWWSQLPDELPLLEGWAGGSHAAALGDKTDAELEQIAISSLANILGTDTAALRDKLRKIHVVNWQRVPYIGGGYSYAIPGSSAARLQLGKPVANTLYFAGEAVYDGPASGTVEAAVVSATLAASAIITSV